MMAFEFMFILQTYGKELCQKWTKLPHFYGQALVYKASM